MGHTNLGFVSEQQLMEASASHFGQTVKARNKCKLELIK